MSTLVDRVKSIVYEDGYIRATMESDVEICFPIAGNPRLSKGSVEQLNNIEVSPFCSRLNYLDGDCQII